MKSLAQVVRRWPSQEAKEWLASFIPQACSHPSVLAVVAFGAAVRTTCFTADIDLLIIYDRPKPILQRRPIDVDIRWYERTQAEHLIGEGQELLGWVLRFGELICERTGYWTNLRLKWVDRMPFPSAALADDRAKRAWRLHQELHKMGDEDAAQEQQLVALTQEARAPYSGECLPRVETGTSRPTSCNRRIRACRQGRQGSSRQGKSGRRPGNRWIAFFASICERRGPTTACFGPTHSPTHRRAVPSDRISKPSFSSSMQVAAGQLLLSVMAHSPSSMGSRGGFFGWWLGSRAGGARRRGRASGGGWSGWGVRNRGANGGGFPRRFAGPRKRIG